MNGRVEVPALEHDGLVVVSSADIVAYLERVFPERAVYPADASEWVRARAWERCADSVIDPILIDISYWSWAERDDEMPAGMLDAARRDLEPIYAALERDLQGREFVCGALSIADFALFPHMVSTRPLGVGFDRHRFPALAAWLRRKLFWRGERIEWVLARGFHDWFAKEIREGRVIWPGLGIPAPRR